jgi:hypothetical protein
VLARIEPDEASRLQHQGEPIFAIEADIGGVAFPPGLDDGKEAGVAQIDQCAADPQTGFFEDLARRRVSRRLAERQASGHRLPEAGGAGPFQQQKLAATGADDDQHRLSALACLVRHGCRLHGLVIGFGAERNARSPPPTVVPIGRRRRHPAPESSRRIHRHPAQARNLIRSASSLS